MLVPGKARLVPMPGLRACAAALAVLLAAGPSCATTHLVDRTDSWWTLEDGVEFGGFEHGKDVLLFGLLIVPCLAWDVVTLPVQAALATDAADPMDPSEGGRGHEGESRVPRPSES